MELLSSHTSYFKIPISSFFVGPTLFIKPHLLIEYEQNIQIGFTKMIESLLFLLRKLPPARRNAIREIQQLLFKISLQCVEP